MHGEVGQRASKGSSGGVGVENRIPMTRQPHHLMLGSSRLIRLGIYFPPCFKERRDQRDLNKVGEQRLGDLGEGKRGREEGGAMPMSRDDGATATELYMICPFKLAGRAGAKGPVRDSCFQRPLHPTERANALLLLLLMAWEFYRGNVNLRNRIHSQLVQ